MKTFLDIILSSENDAILKSYKINGNSIQFIASQFKHIINNAAKSSNTLANSYIYFANSLDIVGKLEKISENIISITFKHFCSKCNGTGEIECSVCDGSGECICYECGASHDCGECEGAGTHECDKCTNGLYDEDEIIYYIEIDLTQGELF